MAGPDLQARSSGLQVCCVEEPEVRWIYYSAQILFFGAKFTKVYANRYGAGIIPARNAVRVTEEIGV